MINCHQNEKNDQKGHKTALNSHNCVLLTIFCFQQHHVLNLVNYVNFITFGCAGSTSWGLAGK